MNSLKKILYVIPGLQKAGAEKYLYELINALDKSKYEPHILTTSEIYSNEIFPHYYYFKLKDHVSICPLLHPKIISLYKLRSTLSKNKVGLKIGNVAYRFVNKIQSLRHGAQLRELIKDFDLVSIIDSPAYPFVKKYINKAKEVDIHLMSHASQFDYDVFKPFNKSVPLNVVYIDSYQLENLKDAGLSVAKSVYFPLSLNTELYKDKVYFDVESSVFRIGIFARINRHKPIDKIIEAFFFFRKMYQKPTILHVFGFKQDEEYFDSITDFLERNDIVDQVIFEGHADNMFNSILDKNINLVWAPSNFDFIGYSSIEIGIRGVPIILRNIDSNKKFKLNNENNLPPFFYEPEKLAAFTLNNQHKIQELGEKLSLYLTKKHDIFKNMKSYESYLEELLG